MTCLIMFYISTKYHKISPKCIPLTERTRNQCLPQSNITKGANAKSKKGRLVFLVRNMSSHPVLHFYQVTSKYSQGYWSYSVDKKSISNKTKGINSKSKKARVVILVHDTSSRPVVHFYQVSSIYSKGYSSYRADVKIYADTDANGIRPKKQCPHTLRYEGT